jgi:hypothetical protein
LVALSLFLLSINFRPVEVQTGATTREVVVRLRDLV